MEFKVGQKVQLKKGVKANMHYNGVKLEREMKRDLRGYATVTEPEYGTGLLQLEGHRAKKMKKKYRFISERYRWYVGVDAIEPYQEKEKFLPSIALTLIVWIICIAIMVFLSGLLFPIVAHASTGVTYSTSNEIGEAISMIFLGLLTFALCLKAPEIVKAIKTYLLGGNQDRYTDKNINSNITDEKKKVKIITEDADFPVNTRVEVIKDYQGYRTAGCKGYVFGALNAQGVTEIGIKFDYNLMTRVVGEEIIRTSPNVFVAKDLVRKAGE